jgi:nucleotide-binding universal stress UspA family protein
VAEHNVDLVVMGTHGRQGLDRLLSGSVSEEVVRQSTCPVFTVLGRDEPQPGPEIQSVLAPVDFSEPARLGLAHARELAQVYDATLDLMHIVEDVVFPSVYGIDPIAPQLPDVQQRAAEALERMADEVIGGAVPTNLHVIAGYAARDIIDFADENDTGLIAMATHGRTGLERFLIGSVTEKVIRSASCPVFTVKPFGKSLLPASVLSSDADAAS